MNEAPIDKPFIITLSLVLIIHFFKEICYD